MELGGSSYIIVRPPDTRGQLCLCLLRHRKLNFKYIRHASTNFCSNLRLKFELMTSAFVFGLLSVTTSVKWLAFYIAYGVDGWKMSFYIKLQVQYLDLGPRLRLLTLEFDNAWADLQISQNISKTTFCHFHSSQKKMDIFLLWRSSKILCNPSQLINILPFWSQLPLSHRKYQFF